MCIRDRGIVKAAFAAKNESDDELITKIQANAYFQRLTDSSELICVAVDV